VNPEGEDRGKRGAILRAESKTYWQSLDFFVHPCLNMHKGAGMKGMARWSRGVFIVLFVVLGIGSGPNIYNVQADLTCSENPIPAVTQILSMTSQYQWLTYLQELTGEVDVSISGQVCTIATRFTPNLFDGSEDGLAFIYIEEQLAAMQYPPNAAIDQFGYLEHDYTFNGNHWQNLILTIPGQDSVDPRELILSAHLDDLPIDVGPGAEDNGVGATGLLEIARILRYFQFNVTIKLIWFTGEEQGLRGSQAFLSDFGAFSEDLIGVINLDMFGYDSDGDDCFEIHAGDLPESYVLGDCLVNIISAYDLPLTFDYIKAVVPAAVSDHRPFWANDFGAIELLENHFPVQVADEYHQCGIQADANPYYHSVNDTIANSLDVPLAFNLVKASLATAATISEPQGACFSSQPELTLQSSLPSVALNWQQMGEWITYRLYRSTTGCDGPWIERADNLYTTSFLDAPLPAPDLAYRLEAISPSGTCISLPSNCVSDISIQWSFLPMVAKFE
jgi:hypothetical protein